MWFNRGTLFFILAFAILSEAFAERYVVKEDSFGNTGAAELSSLDDEELDELERKQAEAKEISNIESEARQLEGQQLEAQAPTGRVGSDESPVPTFEIPGQAFPSPSSVEAESEAEPRSDLVQPEQSTTSKSTTGQDDLLTEETTDEAKPRESAEPASDAIAAEAVNEQESDDPFLREYKRTEADETDEVIRQLRQRAGGSDYDATLVDPADFVDSEDLLKGNVDSQGEQPFYITINSEGESDVIFYSPKVIQEEIDRLKFEEQVSDAVVFFPSDQDDSGIELPEGADPKALAILSGGQQESYFSRFVERCCQGLPNVGVLRLKTEQSAFADFKREDFSYRFVDGDSRYSLIRLPDLRRKYLVTIKTFVKSYKRRGIESGAFIPQVVILDRDKNVKRIISSMSSRSHAETWTSYGFLKSVIEIDQTTIDADAFILLYTTAENLRRSTIIEDTSNQWEIQHMETGSVEVAVVESSL